MISLTKTFIYKSGETQNYPQSTPILSKKIRMKQANYLLIHVLRALKAAESKRKETKKAQLYFLGIDAVNILKKSLEKNPEMLRDISNRDEYSERNWKEIEGFLLKYKNLSPEILEEFHNYLTVNLHLELLEKYKKSVSSIKDFSENSPQNEFFLTEYDKTLKCIRSCKVLLNTKNFEKHSFYEDIKYIHEKALGSMAQFLLKNPEFDFCSSETYSPLSGDIADKAIECIRNLNTEILNKQKKSTQNKSTNNSDKNREKSRVYKNCILSLEKIFHNYNSFKKLFEPNVLHRLFLKTCEGLISYYEWIDDMDNLLMVRAKKEILDLSNTHK